MRAIGNMEHQITLQEKTTTNVGGESTTAWDDPGDTVWAEIVSQKGTEAFEAARQQASSTIRVRIHYRDDVGNGWRFLWDGEYYYIENVDRTRKRQGELWFTAKLSGAR